MVLDRAPVVHPPLTRTAPGTHRYPPLVSRISVVGVPSSAASYAAGQDLAPAALRSAGLLEQLIASGLQVHDDGDLPLYLDRHYDLNTPESTTDGALDWMGLAHALALPGCLDTRCAGDPAALTRFVTSITRVLAATIHQVTLLASRKRINYPRPVRTAKTSMRPMRRANVA